MPSPVPAFERSWAELPARDNSLTEIAHYITDVSLRTADGEYIRNYAMGYDKTKKAALWAAYPLHDIHLSAYGGASVTERDYDFDPALEATEQMYKGVSLPYNKGHQVPNADRRMSNAANAQISYYSNMTPQIGTFNSGAWGTLEGKVRANVCADTLYVVTGCHFGADYTTTTDNGGYDCAVPTHYYKVLLRTRDGATGKSVAECSAEELQCIGFWYDNIDNSEKTQTATGCAMSVEAIEAKVGFTFFVNVPNAPKSSFSTSDWEL